MSVLDYVEQRPVVHALDASISMAEVVKACQQQKNSKAPGGDGIPADVWKYGPEELQEQLLLVLNKHGARELYRRRGKTHAFVRCSRKVTERTQAITAELRCLPLPGRY